MKTHARQSAAALIDSHFRKLYAVGQAAGLLDWDQQVMMPAHGAALREAEVEALSGLLHQLRIDQDFMAALEEALSSGTLTPGRCHALVRLQRESRQAARVPASLVTEIASLQVRCHGTWKTAREKSDFRLFQKDLSRLVELKTRYAECIREGRRQPLYEALVSAYEPDFPARRMEALFADLRRELVPLAEKIVARTPAPARRGWAMPVADQQALSRGLVELMGFDLEAGRIDTALHPFCSGGVGDVRLTTRYHEKDWTSSVFSVMHEAGHGIYEQNVGRAFAISPEGLPPSLGIHESQSRFWENCVGRSREFQTPLLRLARGAGKVDSRVTAESLFAKVNRPAFSYIRIEADEVTYNLHIMLRYEMESALFSGRLAVADAAEAWREKVKSFLHLKAPCDREGVLQDIHWSAGLFGYFPTYTIGNLIAAQLLKTVRRDLPFDELCRKGKLSPLREWLERKVHKAGCRKPTLEIVKGATGAELGVGSFVDYLEEKFTRA